MKLIIWDKKGSPSKNIKGTIIFWQHYSVDKSLSAISMPSFVEKHSDILRQKYLSLIYEFGEMAVNGKKIYQHLELRDGLNYWWMSLIAEKSNYAKSKYINQIIKVFALQLWCENINIQQLEIYSEDDSLVRSVSTFVKQRRSYLISNHKKQKSF